MNDKARLAILRYCLSSVSDIRYFGRGGPGKSNDHAAEHEQHAAIGDFTFDQLRAEMVRLSRQTDTGSPLPAFLDLRRLRDRIYTLLDRRL